MYDLSMRAIYSVRLHPSIPIARMTEMGMTVTQRMIIFALTGTCSSFISENAIDPAIAISSTALRISRKPSILALFV